MIGNDIVDLALARKESNWNRKGFLDKIFTLQEQLLINSSKNKEIMIWTLWSRKEAAYKIYNRLTGIRKYNPIQFECLNLGIDIVVYENQLFYTRTQMELEYVYSEAVIKQNDFDKVKSIKRPFTINKRNGCPSYLDCDCMLEKPLSITHHGRYEKIITII